MQEERKEAVRKHRAPQVPREAGGTAGRPQEGQFTPNPEMKPLASRETCPELLILGRASGFTLSDDPGWS